MQTSIGELYEIKHPISGIVEMWEVQNVSGDRVELKAITGNYVSDLDRTLSARTTEISKYKSSISGPAA